jgi:AcrR family transcriptional regulator
MEEKKTRANGRASRKAILAAAADVFAENGYRGTSLTEIANRVGMTQPGLLHHFNTKDQLLLAVIQEHETTSEHSHSMVEDLGPENFLLVESIEKLATSNMGARQAQLLLTTLSAEAIPRDHPLHEHFVQRYRTFRRGLATILARAQEHGKVREDINPQQVAREMIATLDGLHLQWLLDPKEINLKKALRTYAERLADDLAPTGVRTAETASV